MDIIKSQLGRADLKAQYSQGWIPEASEPGSKEAWSQEVLKHHFTPMNYFFPSWESCLLMVPTPAFHPSQSCVLFFFFFLMNPRGTGTNSTISLSIYNGRSIKSIHAVPECLHPAGHQNLRVEPPSGCSKVTRLDLISEPSSVASVKPAFTSSLWVDSQI